MHHLHLTDAAIDGFNAMAHVRPPFRSESDRQALIAGVRDGVIDAVCSDHQPLDASAKLAPFAEALPGISSLETLLPLGLWRFDSGRHGGAPEPSDEGVDGLIDDPDAEHGRAV